MVQKHQLSCCALCQLTASNYTPIEDIEAQIEKLKKESNLKWHPGDRRSGERACFVITTPSEHNLCKNLKQLGFKSIATFNRRNGYPEGILTMHFLNW